MTILRTDIERALDEIASQEGGMLFQGLAAVLGRKHWPELIACERKNDLGLDAYASASQTPEKVGKGLSASITPALGKISGDVTTAKANFPDLKMLLFVTPAKVGNRNQNEWKAKIQQSHGLELHIISREDIIISMMMSENASLCASFLNLNIDVEPEVAGLIERARRAADVVVRSWAGKIKGRPLIDLTAMRIDPNGAESVDMLSIEKIDQVLSQSGRIVLEGPAGRGKTTTLIQIAQHARTAGIPFIVDFPAWASSPRPILDYIAGIPAFQAEGVRPADLARMQKTEPFLFLLNGWNEVAASNSDQASNALRELERDFPSAGIIVATRTHHLMPPLPGALRLRLLRLRRAQRAGYLTDRLGAQSTDLRTRIDADPSLDELTKTPFILSEVASLFEACVEIPSTKIGILDKVIRMQEQRDEHRNPLQIAPIFGEQTEYLKAIATKMISCGSVSLPKADAGAVVAAVSRELIRLGRIEPVAAPAVLAMLTAHHVLERVDYPQAAFQFEHQQLQEYYAALDVRTRLLDLQDNDHDETGRFTADYVNDPAWAEPLHMIAEAFAEQTGNNEIERRSIIAGRKLVEMALAVDLVFSAKLAQLCGPEVWNEVRAAAGERFRAVYTIHDGSFRQYAIAAMLATGADDFIDIIVPLLSRQDQQARLQTYRLWPDVQVSSLGSNWRGQVSGWNEGARTDFVSELLHHRIDGGGSDFAAEDDSIAVKKAAVSGLMWAGSDDALTLVLNSMDAQTFEEIARQNPDHMPASLRPKTIAAMRKFLGSTTDHPARLRTALDLIHLGETGLDNIIKDAMAALPGGDMRNLGPHYIKPALEHLRKNDPPWVSEWVAIQIGSGVLYEHEYWLPFATAIPDGLIEKYLQRLETEDLKNGSFGGMISVIAARADANLAARLFAKLRDLRRGVDAEPSVRHALEWQIMRQLEAVFRGLPGDIAAAGILSSVTSGDPLDIKVATCLLSRVAKSDVEPLHIADDDLKVCLLTYLKGSIDVVLRQDDFNGEEKANLASSIAQVGKREDMASLTTLIRADIERVRRGRAARAAGDLGPPGNGGAMSYAGWHIAAVVQLDSAGADQVLIDLLPEQEYRSEAAAAMARDFVLKSERFFDRTFRYDLIWAAREGRTPPLGDDQRRARFAAALDAEIKRLREQNRDGKLGAGPKELAKALAAIDGSGSATTVLDVISMPSQWDQDACLDAAERLLMTGVVLPATIAFALVDSIIDRMEKWVPDSERRLLLRVLMLCPFSDEPSAGVAKIRDVLSKRKFGGHELRDVVTALGESRSDAAVDLLYDLASDAPKFEQLEDKIINAISILDTSRARDLILGFVDPDIGGIVRTRRSNCEEVLVARLTELARRSPEVATRLLQLCERDLPEPNRHILSRVMSCLGTPEASAANLKLIDDAKPLPVPRGIWDQLESSFVERKPYGQNQNAFTQHARASNELRVRLFKMAISDEKRRKSCFALLGQIEVWRLDHGRPSGEPRHPDLISNQSWPPNEI